MIIPALSPKQIAAMKAAFDEFGITDHWVRAAIVAINIGESGMTPHTELGYAATSNARIRLIFGGRVSGLSESALRQAKVSDETFFNIVYGGAFGLRALGNTEPGDGFKYRGRGLNQLTGRSNYAHYTAVLKDVDLVDDPGKANDLATAARISVAYMRDRVRPGTSWTDMKRAVGVEVASTEAVKNAAYSKLVRDRTFD